MEFDVKKYNPLTEGGEGYIYEYKGKIIKIFKPHIDIKSKENKVKALMNKTLNNAVVRPIDIVKDRQGKFIGYAMKKVEGEEFERLANKKFCKTNGINTKFVLDILVKVKNVLQEIHKQKIYIGDLNDQNILFDMSGNVYFLDCDSWAIGNEKCTVAMDLFKDPQLVESKFNEKTDNYAFCVFAWKSLTRIHPFGGTITPDIPIMKRIEQRISVIDRNVKIPKMVKSWNGFSPDLVKGFKNVFENDMREIPESLEDMQKNLSYCKKDDEYYYSKFSSCPYCDSTAQVNKKPISQGTVGGFKVYAVYDGKEINIMFDRHTYLDKSGMVCNNNMKTTYRNGVKYYFLNDGKLVEDMQDFFVIHSAKDYQIDKKHRTPIECDGNSIYFISPQNIFSKIDVLDAGNAIKNIYKTSNNAYFSVDNGDYCILNYYSGKLIVNMNGMNVEIDYNFDIKNYGIHKDRVSGKWLVLLKNQLGLFNTYVLNKSKIEYQTDQIKYECGLNCVCIDNSTIFIPIDTKIRGFSYQKSLFRDFECSVVSEESRLIKDGNRFVIVNLDNVYYFGK